MKKYIAHAKANPKFEKIPNKSIEIFSIPCSFDYLLSSFGFITITIPIIHKISP